MAKIPRLQPYFLTKIGSFSSLVNLQSKSLNFNFGHFSLIYGQNTKAIALHFGQNWLIFITFQSAIKINQFQFRSFLAHLWPKYQGFSPTFWPILAHFHHFSICNPKSINFNFGHFSLIYGQNTKAIALHFGQNWLIFITFQSAIKINQFQFRSFFAHLWPKYQGYSLTFWPKLAHFHHFSICNQNQSISNLVIFEQHTKAIALLFGQKCLIFITFQSVIKINQFQFRSFLAHLWPKYQGYSLTFWPKLAHFHHFSICNQNQSISISVISRSFVAKIPRLQPYILAKIGSFSSLFNLQSKSINFNFGHFSLICGQHSKAIALHFGQNWLIFITFQSVIKINQFQFRSFLSHLWPTYQGYSPTFWPKLAPFHHFSICN